VVTSNGAAATDIELDMYKDGTVTPDRTAGVASVAGGVTYISFVVEESAYYRLRPRVSRGWAAVVTYLIAYTGPVTVPPIAALNFGVFCHLMLPGFFINMASARHMRLAQHCRMFSNTAAQIVEGGQVAAYQTDGTQEWTTYFIDASDPLGAIASLPTAADWPAKKGLHSFLVPTGSNDLDARDVAISQATVNVYPLPFALNGADASAALLLVIKVPNSNVAGQSGIVKFVWGAEYYGDDIWREYQHPDIDPVSYTRALFKLGAMEQHHENPSHLKAIGKWVRNAVKTVGRAASRTAGFLSDVGGAAALLGAL